jgi:hypothetical protein
MLHSFRIDAPGLAGITFIIERPMLESSGGPESAFLEAAGPVARHPGSLGRTLQRLAAERGTRILAVIRNAKLVLDEGLAARIAAARERLDALEGRWSVAAAGGLAAGGGVVSALYSSATPHLPLHPDPAPLVDLLPDLWLADAAWLRAVGADAPLPEAALETALVTEGYLEGRAALYLPELVAGIDGGLRPREPLAERQALAQHFAGRLAGEDIATLAGPAAIPPGGEAASGAGLLAEAVEHTIAALCDPLSLSIVTRTRFDRPHLVERLLASITRARPERGQIEVVLSSDAPPEICEAAFAALSARFLNLSLRLQRNEPGRHSRVTNLIGGIRAAAGEYVAILDDDDHVDLAAFLRMERALFLGARPLIVADSEVHEEEWVTTPSGRHVLARSQPGTTYPAAGWRDMFGGVNRLPVCALMMPRERLLARLGAFEFRHDLSEDYALNLLMLTDPQLPPVVELGGTFGHISLRRGEGQSMTLSDRRPWVRDIALYLAELARAPGVARPGQWALLAGRKAAEAAQEGRRRAELEAALARCDRDLRLALREIACLRGALASAGGATQQSDGAGLPHVLAGQHRGAA